jgi:hypothetical protein
MPGSKEELVSATIPANPFSPVTVIVDVEDRPAVIVRAVGLADRVKSGPITSTPTNVV